MTGVEGQGDRLARRVTLTWQESVRTELGADIETEYFIGQGFRECIDLVDTRDGVAYELKVSPNNTHFEFYRDIFKVAVARANALPSIY